MSVENIYYKRIKKLELENSALSRKVVELEKEIERLEELRDEDARIKYELRQRLEEQSKHINHLRRMLNSQGK